MRINLDNFKQINGESTIVVAGADDHIVLESLNNVTNKLIINVILIGNQATINEMLSGYSLNIKEIIHETDPIKIGELAVQCVKENKANVIMKGMIDTKFLLKAIVNSETGIKKQKVLSHVALIDYPDFNSSLIASDCAMNITPSIEEKWEIINNAVDVAHKLNITNPNVALISAVEKLNPKIISTTDAQSLVDKFQLLKPNDFNLDGPFALDNVLSREAAMHKNITSDVALNPNILIFPDLVSGNIFYKASVFLSGGTVAGVIIGATVPIILTSRGDSVVSKMNSIILGIALSK